MTGEQLKALRLSLGLTRAQAAILTYWPTAKREGLIMDNGHQQLTIEEITERFYVVRGQRDKLIAVTQKIRPFIYAWQRGGDAAVSLSAIDVLCNEAIRAVHGDNP